MAAEHDALPVPDYDHIPLGTLPSRISALDEDGVQELLDYEEAHGHRLPVVEVLRHRIEALRSGAVTPSGAVEQDMPEVTRGSAGSPVSPATSGPHLNPPSHGVPGNPAR